MNDEYRSVSNLDWCGQPPQRYGSQAAVRHHGTVEDALHWLKTQGGGGVVYRDLDDSVVAAIRPDGEVIRHDK